MQQKSKFNSSVALDPSSDCQFPWSSNISWEVWQSLFITADTLPCVKSPYVWSVCFFFFICLCALMSQLHYKSSLPPSKSLLSGVFFGAFCLTTKGCFMQRRKPALIGRRKKQKNNNKTFQDCGNSCCWLPLSQGWYSCVVSHQSRTSPLHLCPL